VSPAERPTFADVHQAASALTGIAHRTPVLADDLLDARMRTTVKVKAEFLQRGGAYKFRGIFNKVRLLTAAERSRGIVTISSGNAGIAASYAARLQEMSCVVVMPEAPVKSKLEAIEALGATVVRHGSSSVEMATKAAELTAGGRVLVHPFDQPEVVAGQGTVALELLEQEPHLDAIVVPAGGGGLLGGVALVLAELGADIELIAAQPTGADSLKRSLEAGAVIEAERVDTLADGLAVKRCGQLTFELIRERLNDVILVDDDQILAAVATYWRLLHVAIEPAGAVALAAVAHDRRFRNRRVAVVASGGNIDTRLLQHALDGGTASRWKLAAT
jgi:threonine dehydratase